MDYSSVRRALAGQPLYIHGPKLNELLALAELRPKASVSSRAAKAQYPGGGAIAVIPIVGPISHRSSPLSWLFGGVSTADISGALRQVVADPGISAIVLDIDSPGGDVAGVDELATEIYQARQKKPVTALCNCLCASAAYYLASQASEIIASPSSLTGSIGVYVVVEDDSRMLDKLGINLQLIKYGDNKADGAVGPLSDSGRDHLQKLVNTYGRAFEAAVARGRGIKQSDVHDKFGQGHVFDARRAANLGMADRVGTLDDALKSLATSSGRRQAQMTAERRQLRMAAGGSPVTTAAQRRRAEFARMRHELELARA